LRARNPTGCGIGGSGIVVSDRLSVDDSSRLVESESSAATLVFTISDDV
jgi:hypothetical protein